MRRALLHCSCGLGITLTNVQYKKLTSSEEKWICGNCCGDQTLSAFRSVDPTDVFHFDFQQNMHTPKLTVGKQFYMRLLWTYLFGIFSASCNITSAFMWNELVVHRSSNDVVSCLAHFIFKTRLVIRERNGLFGGPITAGQNKNHCVVWFFITTGVYSRVDYKFLVVGHTYGPTDRCFGGIEKYIRKIENV